MASIQKTFSIEKPTGQTTMDTMRIEVQMPRFGFRLSENGIQRYVGGHQNFAISHDPQEENYRVPLPLARLVGADIKDIYGFFRYHFIEVLNQQHSINDFSVTFTVHVKDPYGQEIISETFEGLFYKKKSQSSDYDRRDYGTEYAAFEQTYGPIGSFNQEGLKSLPEEWDSQIFLINKHTFELIKYLFSSGNSENNVSDIFVLEFIQALTDMRGPYPQLTTIKDLIGYTQMIDLLREREIELSEESYRYLIENFNTLFDFPLTVPEIQQVAIRGTLEVVSEQQLTEADLDFYDLSVAYHKEDNTPEILRYNWADTTSAPRENRVDFAFGSQQAIITNGINGLIAVTLKGFDGAVLWEKHFNPSDEGLQNLTIRIHAYPNKGTGAGRGSGVPESGKKLRGRVLQRRDEFDLNDLTIVVQAKREGDEIHRIVAATKTDKSGNFSMDYPYGNYAEAQALVSIMPNSPANLHINPEQANEVISDDFIYLMLTTEDVVAPEHDDTETHDDCDCHKPNKAKRLPDQADLIESDEYTQDIGGRCLNLSTPNRTLSEYSYNAIVRTSDPDVANYVLQKNVSDGHVTYELVGGHEKLQRGIVDLDNPIRWEDAPDAKENLSLYQAVTVATGHIIHFKSVFKADGYSLGDLVYSLPLAPGQKKQIVVFESSHSLSGTESQTLSQGESLSAELVSDRTILDQLSGGINENLSGSSKAHTSGLSAGLGAAGSYGGIGASLGVAGGFANSNSSASQNSARNISQFFGEKLRQSLMQNAESYRRLNASVVTTVTQGQQYGVTAEVVANHNHCHSLTMMYFEVLRHYAIFQEVSHVEECVFVPLLLTHFTTENIHKWKDILAQNLLPIPSNTYLRSPGFHFLKIGLSHPLLKAFDANERIKTHYERVDDFPPEGSTYADGLIRNIKGEFTLRIHLKRPKSKYDRIKSLPIITQTVTRQEIDPYATAKKGFGDAVLGFFTGGLSFIATGAPGTDVQFKTVEEEILVKAQIFDQFMTLDANYQHVPPAKCIRINTFKPRAISLTLFGYQLTGTYSGAEFFEDGMLDRRQWNTYARILGYSDVYDFLEYYFAGRLIAEWDDIFEQDILPEVYSLIIDSIRIEAFSWDLTSTSRYEGGHARIRVRLNGATTKTRAQLPENLHITCNNSDVLDLKGGYTTLILENISITYTTDFFDGKLYQGYSGDDLLDGTNLYIPLTARDKINPRKEDAYLVNALIEHLNSNIEHYNKVLWANLDPDRRYMLLDGFNIQTYTATGHRSVMRSLASVVKNELITITGNSLVFPVANGYQVGRNSMLEEVGENAYQETSLIDYYKPLKPMPPYRLSVPTRGVFMEAIQGNCDACEPVKENSSQDWNVFRTEEPTPISPVVTPTPTITDYKPQYKDFAQPLVNIQNAPDAPAPAAGMAQLSELLGKAGVFNDITGLAGNQDNVMRTYLSNQENAKAFAEMAKSMASQQHNTQNAQGISESITEARRNGNITAEDAQALTRQHLQQQIDGGESTRETAQFEREQNRPSLAEVAASAVDRGQTVQAQRTDADGTHESIEVRGAGDADETDISYEIDTIQQPSSMTCWATAATMLMNWKNSTSSRIEDVLQDAGSNLDPADEDYYLNMFTANQGLPAEEKDRFITSLGMVGEAPANYPLSQYVEWLQNYGPLWVTIDAGAGSDFSPHAKILYRIAGRQFHFINPTNGVSEELSFEDFVADFEQMATDMPDDQPLFIQVVRFADRLPANTEGGGARELYQNTSIGSRLTAGDTVQGHPVNVATSSVRMGGYHYRLRNGTQWGIIYGGRNTDAFSQALNDLAASYRAEGATDSEFKALAALGFAVVSEHEGKVTAVNTWDNMDFTWGAGFAAERLNNVLQFLPTSGGLFDLLNGIPWLRGNRFNRELFRSGPEHLDLEHIHALVQNIEQNATYFSQMTAAQARQFVENEVMASADTPEREAMMNTIGSATVSPVVGVAGYLNHGRPAYARIPVEMLHAAIAEGGANYTKQVAALFRIYMQTVNEAALGLNREDRLELIYQTLANRVSNKIKAFNQAMRNSVQADYEFNFAEANEVLPCINPDFTIRLLDGPDGVRVTPLRMWVQDDAAYPSPNVSMNYDTSTASVRRYRGYYNLGTPLTVPNS